MHLAYDLWIESNSLINVAKIATNTDLSPE
jgi:hypothetical protein